MYNYKFTIIRQNNEWTCTCPKFIACKLRITLISLGIVLEILFDSRLKSSKLSRNLISRGMVPSILLLDKSNDLSNFNCTIRKGILPSRILPLSLRCSSPLISPIKCYLMCETKICIRENQN